MPGLVSQLEACAPHQIDRNAITFAGDAELVGNASNRNRLACQEFLQNEMRLTTVQLAKNDRDLPPSAWLEHCGKSEANSGLDQGAGPEPVAGCHGDREVSPSAWLEP